MTDESKETEIGDHDERAEAIVGFVRRTEAAVMGYVSAMFAWVGVISSLTAAAFHRHNGGVNMVFACAAFLSCCIAVGLAVRSFASSVSDWEMSMRLTNASMLLVGSAYGVLVWLAFNAAFL